MHRNLKKLTLSRSRIRPLLGSTLGTVAAGFANSFNTLCDYTDNELCGFSVIIGCGIPGLSPED